MSWFYPIEWRGNELLILCFAEKTRVGQNTQTQRNGNALPFFVYGYIILKKNGVTSHQFAPLVRVWKQSKNKVFFGTQQW